MKNLFLVLGAILSVSSVKAESMRTSLHPCTPTIEAQDSRLQCRDLNNRYSITISTLMSPRIPMCSGNNYFERHTATVEVTNLATGQKVDEIVIFHADFSYELGLPGMSEGRFTSEANNIELEGCITPAHGGVSIGN